MDQSQLRGDFAAFLNRDKQPGDNRPMFEGHLTRPGDTEKYPMTLWAREYTDPATGEIKIRYSGTIGAYAAGTAPADQVAALTSSPSPDEQALGGLTVRPRQVILFPNRFKDDEPDKQRPDLWGGANFGDGTPIVRLSVWMQQTRTGQAMLSGATSFPLPGKSEAQMQDAEPELGNLVARGDVSIGMPKGKRRSEGRG